MAKRYAIPAHKSRKMFSRTAGNQKVHPKNVLAQPVNRGGIRL